jgi:hypothetical protein
MDAKPFFMQEGSKDGVRKIGLSNSLRVEAITCREDAEVLFWP